MTYKQNARQGIPTLTSAKRYIFSLTDGIAGGIPCKALQYLEVCGGVA